jgi:hypothetical protein
MSDPLSGPKSSGSLSSSLGKMIAGRAYGINSTSRMGISYKSRGKQSKR